MKAETLKEAMGLIDDRHLDRADRAKTPKKRAGWVRWAGMAAAVLAAAILLIALPGRDPARTAYAVSEAVYPEMEEYPNSGQQKQVEKWRADYRRQRSYDGAGKDLDAFFRATAPQFLAGAEGENRVYSPLNVYMALAMLAEITGGESRAQVLELLGSRELKALRTQAHAVWNANYRDDGAVASILGNSLWLNGDLQYKRSVLDTLAETYYASSYQGEMGSEGFSAAYREWLDRQTGGLLADQIRDRSLAEGLALVLDSTIFFRAKWASGFASADTARQVFHSPEGDRETDFMHKTDTGGSYCRGQRFSAAELPLKEKAGNMWFILPDEGFTPEDLLSDEEALLFLSGPGRENAVKLKINLSLPKFDVRSQMDLKAGLEELGITDVFDGAAADFTPLLSAGQAAELSAVEHGARVTVDEEGVTAAAYTEMPVYMAGIAPVNEVDLVLDRPFIFLISGPDDLPLFIGIVNQP